MKNNGFLPETDPLQQLPPAFDAWEYVAANLPKYLVTGGIRATIEALPPFDFDKLLEDNNYLAIINSIKVHRNIITRSLNGSLRESQKVLQLIKEELNYTEQQ